MDYIIDSLYRQFRGSSLHDATYKGNIEAVKAFLNEGASVDELSNWRVTPLHIAVVKGHEQIVEYLIVNGANVNYVPRTSSATLLNLATKIGNESIIKLLLKYNANVNARDGQGLTPLYLALYERNHVILELLLQHGANANASAISEYEYSSHSSPLCIAVENVDDKVLRVLLRYGGDIHTQCKHVTEKGFTLLHSAAQLGSMKVIDLLIKHGADINAKDINGKTPLYWSLENDDPEVYEFLLNCGAVIQEASELLLIAVTKGKTEIVEDLLKQGTDINGKDEDGRTALHLSLSEGHEELSKLLLTRGAAFDLKDEIGDTPLHEATRKGFSVIVNDLLNSGACINSINHEGYTPLHCAACCGNETIAKMLLKNNAEVDVMNTECRTPLFCAVEGAFFDASDVGSIVNQECEAFGEKEVEHLNPWVCTIENRRGEIVKMLLSKGSDVNTVNVDGRSVLKVAVEEKYENIAKTLLEFGADVNYGVVGTSQFDSSESDENENITDMLSNGVNTEYAIRVISKDEDGERALHIAARNGCLNIVKTLLRHGAYIDSRDSSGQTALYIASKRKYDHVFKYLLEYGADINATIINKKCISFSCPPRLSFWEKKFYNSDIRLRHLVKLKAANLYVTDDNLAAINQRAVPRTFHGECEREIDRMKCEDIAGAISLYDILAKPLKQVVAYARNEKIRKVLDSCHLKENFPIYASMLECRYERAKDEMHLMELATESFNALTGFALPYVIVTKILSYVDIIGLRYLCRASDMLLEYQ